MAFKKVRLIYNLLLAIKIHITTDHFDKNDNIYFFLLNILK